LDLKSRVGETAGPFQETAEAARVSLFAKAVSAREIPEINVPPTYPTVCRKGEFELLRRFNIELAHVLHGEQEYAYTAPIRVGDIMSYDTTLVQANRKQGTAGSLQFLVFETRIRVGEEVAVIARSTIVVRGGGE
jgi:hypothetical protein